MSLKPVQLTKNYPPYRDGEIAGFEEKIANILIEKGYAIDIEKPKKSSK